MSSLFRLLCSLSTLFFVAYPLLCAPQRAPFALGWNQDKQGAFVTALLEDQRGNIWAATEDKGVWCYSPDKKGWANYSLKEGLGDDTVYALAEDRTGRIWAGTLRNGVSVWNWQKWQNFGLMDGPLGERVFAISVCPSDGDIWLATNAGLSRYSDQKGIWTYYTRSEGLPSDQVQALAFDSVGTLYAGTQCDGLVIGKSTDDYRTFQVVRGAEKMPHTETGVGLPSSLINDVFVTDNNVVYVATTCGLARSKDAGETWTFG